MCMLSFYPPGSLVDKDQLAAGARKNRDGYGYAIVSGVGPDHICVGKSMNAHELIEEFIEMVEYARRENPQAVALFHSRWGTGGTTNEYNCHPFYMGDGEGGLDELTVVAHNGVFFSPQRFSKDEPRCDTRIFAEEILPEIPMFDNPDVLPFWEDEIGKGNKVVVLTANPAYRRRAYMLNPTSGQWIADGKVATKLVEGVCWHSNSDWRHTVREAYRNTGYEGGGRWDWSTKKWVPGTWDGGRFIPRDEAEPAVKSAEESARVFTGAPAPRTKRAKGPRRTKGKAGRAGAPDHEHSIQVVGDDGWTETTTSTGRHYRFKHDATPAVNPDGSPAECPTCFSDGDQIDVQAGLCLMCTSCLGCGNWPEECLCGKADTPQADTAAVTTTSGAVELYTGGGATKYGPDEACTGTNWDRVTGLCDDADCERCGQLYAERQGSAYVLGSHASLE